MADRLWGPKRCYGVHRCVLDSVVPDPRGPWHRSAFGEPEVCEECQRPENRRARLSVAEDIALLRIIASFVSTSPRDCLSAKLSETSSDADRIRVRTHPAHAKSDDTDESSASSRHF